MSIHAQRALLNDGWYDQVRISIADGRISRIQPAASPQQDDVRLDNVVPGIPNAHSHAFQRALVGHTEHRSLQSQDSFWTWRHQMYQLVSKLDAELLQAIATQLYIEMVCAGYTSVVEFHYLHRNARNQPQSDALLEALVAAASTAGIRLHYLPVFYAHSHFGAQPPSEEQRYFVQDLESYLDHYRRARSLNTPNFSVGMGAHSLRAVDPASLVVLAETARRDGSSFHIHIAEQTAEVEQAVMHLGATPVRWLLDQCSPDSNWCLVHATHMDSEESRDLAHSGAVVCLCPSTEANLGDGLFPLSRFLSAGGQFAIGSDSQVTVNPFEELRWLEYGQRLATRTRNVSAAPGKHCGHELFAACVRGGARAIGFSHAGLTPGAPADLVVLDASSAIFAGHSAETMLDALVFSGLPSPIERVMVAGEWRVTGGTHPAAEQAGEGYANALKTMGTMVQEPGE